MGGKNPLLGMSLSLVGCTCTAVGYTLQKVAHRRASALNAARSAGGLPPLPYWRFAEWLAGLAALVVGSTFAVVVFGLAGQAELAPMGAVTLIVSSLLAWRVLGDVLTRVDAAAISLMAGGTTVALVYAKRESASYTVDAIDALWGRPAVALGAAAAVGSVVAVGAAVARLGRTPVADLPPRQAAMDAFGRGYAGA